MLGDATKVNPIVRVMIKGTQKARRVSGVERLSGKGYWEEQLGDERTAFSAPSFL